MYKLEKDTNCKIEKVLLDRKGLRVKKITPLKNCNYLYFTGSQQACDTAIAAFEKYLNMFVTDSIDLDQLDKTELNPFSQGRIHRGLLGNFARIIDENGALYKGFESPKLLIFGFPKDIEKIKNLVKDLILKNNVKSFNLQDQRKAPAILGHKGVTLKQLSEETGAKINVNLTTGCVTLIGTKEAIAAAEIAVTSKENEVLLEVFDLGPKHMLVARELFKDKGKLILEMQEKTGVHIKRDAEKAVLVGSKLAINKAKAKLKKMVKDSQKSIFERET
eukprot:TRINITY_DN7110_c0_g1_i1.p1 TRINITY_DN7110_c0_g1~~TRINITY_DN7110_c0_g1_i1.p1  ORF type:complete len:288 (+),score=52.71 TRINITY_DN7110_c0_g1_i1:39-866(+)